MHSDSDAGDSDADRELQVAFEAGLLKTNKVNILAKPKINRGADLKARTAQFSKKQLPWIERCDVTVSCGVNEVDGDNDFQRELAFYKQAEAAVKIAVPRLQGFGVRVARPSDYYAEMAKTDSHMQKIRKRLMDVQEAKDKTDTMRRIKEEKRFASKVKQEVLAQRNEEKKKFTEAVKKHKKGMKGQLEDMLNNARKMQLDDDEDDKRTMSRGGSHSEMHKANRNMSRQSRNKKFGFGGQKKRGKHNDKNSYFEDTSIGKRPAGKVQKKIFKKRSR